MVIPECLQHLPKHGALPVPYFTGQTKDGKWDFRTHNPDRHNLAMRYQLCGICGRHVPGPYVFVFGPQSIVDLQTFMPALHEDCARAALALCPYLLNEGWARREGGESREIVEAASLPPKPAWLALVWCERYRAVQGPYNLLYAFGSKPTRVERYAYQGGVLQRDQSVEGTWAATLG